jgi:transglutaminase-like putative cysteine protease
MELRIAAETDLVFGISVASPAALDVESFTFDRDVELTEIVDDHGTRLHTATVGPGTLTVDYRAEFDGRLDPPEVDPLDLIEYLRPSRYCESDALLPTARSEFAGLTGVPLLNSVTGWVSQKLWYAPGSSLPTDGATRTLMARRGVCRDFAHLVVALLRALDVPARMVAVYAPGLSPMDFHAVVEAYVEGGWHVVDATNLAPRQSLLRISTGRDAADTAFLTNQRGDLELLSLEVLAIVDELPVDDGVSLVQLS